MESGNDLLMSGGVPWAVFDNLGDGIVGTIKAEPTARQSRDFDSGELAAWDDGNAKVEIVVMLATVLRDPEVEGDDGTRQLVLPKGSAKAQAVRTAVRKAGAPGLETGGQLQIEWTGEEPPKKRGFHPKKLFTATYIPPANAQLMADDLDDEQAMEALKDIATKK